MNLLHAIPYLFEGELESVVLKAENVGECDVYALANGNVIRFEDEDGDEIAIQAIVEGDVFDGNGNTVEWEPNFYPTQSETRRIEIRKTAPVRYKANSLLVGIEKLLNESAERLYNEQGDSLTKGSILNEIAFEPAVFDPDNFTLDDYKITREHYAMEWREVENG